jgi:cell division protein FtsW (lipid II flippase)
LQNITFCDNICFTNFNERVHIRRILIIGASVISLLVLLAQPAIGNSLLMMLFLGIIPGTSIVLPTWMILLSAVLGSYIAIRWIMNQPMFIGNQEYQEKVARQLARKKVLSMTATPVVAAVEVRPARINSVNRRRVVKA